MKYKDLFFDLDHTIWDFELNSKETLLDLHHKYQLEAKGITHFDEFYSKYSEHNHRLWDRYTKGFIKQDELRLKRIYLSLLDYKIADEQLSKEMSHDYLDILPDKTNLFPYTHEILEYLQNKGYKMHLITNGFEKTQYQKIKNSGIDRFFTHMVTSEQAGIMKPHAAIFEYALNLTKSTAEKCIMIGDTLEVDILGAKNMGMDTVYFNPAKPHNDKVIPTYVIESLYELKTIL